MNLRVIREKADMTQSELAERLNTTSVTICRWENGANEPSIQKMKEICNFFNCTLDDLLSSNPTPPPRRTRGRPKGAAVTAAGII